MDNICTSKWLIFSNFIRRNLQKWAGCFFIAFALLLLFPSEIIAQFSISDGAAMYIADGAKLNVEGEEIVGKGSAFQPNRKKKSVRKRKAESEITVVAPAPVKVESVHILHPLPIESSASLTESDGGKACPCPVKTPVKLMFASRRNEFSLLSAATVVLPPPVVVNFCSFAASSISRRGPPCA
jgi:hypothetical protein